MAVLPEVEAPDRKVRFGWQFARLGYETYRISNRPWTWEFNSFVDSTQFEYWVLVTRLILTGKR